MSTRVRFSQERPDITYVPSTKSGNSSLLSDLLSKPMPPRYSEKYYEMDACTAASIGDKERLIELMRVNPAILTLKNSSGWTPLLYAAYLGHITVTTFLLEKNGNVDDCNIRGQTALMMAAACGNTNVVRLLLDKGANPKLADIEKRQATHYAASCSQNVVVDTLLLHGADPNAADIHGMTPVHEAALTGHELTFLSLLEKGGNIELKNAKGENASHLACDNNKILQIIKEHKKESAAEVLRGNTSEKRTLAELLEEMDLVRYIKQFEHENIDINVFFELKKEDFDDMKVAYGPKKRMLDVIERYRNTGVIRTDAFEGSEAPRCSAAPASNYSAISKNGGVPDEANKYATTLRSIRDINQETKAFAMTALEALGTKQTDRIRSLLIGIIDSAEQITVKLSTHNV